MPPVLIKKYGNRRLYDTGESRYITQDELAAAIKRGVDVRVVDAKTSEDLTQATLAQLVLENAHAARALPVALLTQLIRLDDDALVEFFGRYVTSALELYLTAKRGQAVVLDVAGGDLGAGLGEAASEVRAHALGRTGDHDLEIRQLHGDRILG